MRNIYNISKNLAKAIETEYKTLIPKSEFRVLYILVKHQEQDDEKLTSSQLAHLLQISPPAVSRTVKTLVEKGWLTLEENEEDRRNKFIIISAKGYKAYKSTNNYFEEIVADVRNAYSSEELNQFIAMGENIIQLIQHSENQKIDEVT